jgi:hypothetical protein
MKRDEMRKWAKYKKLKNNFLVKLPLQPFLLVEFDNYSSGEMFPVKFLNKN